MSRPGKGYQGTGQGPIPPRPEGPAASVNPPAPRDLRLPVLWRDDDDLEVNLAEIPRTREGLFASVMRCLRRKGEL